MHWFVTLLIIAGLGCVLFHSARRRSSNHGPVPPNGRVIRFQNPANGYEEDIGTPWIWCLLFGCIYFAVRGVWTHAVAALLLAVITARFSWLVYPFFARAAVERHYFRKGWLPVSR
jgi:hypothetical protein